MDVDPVELAHWKAVAAKPFDEAPRWEYLKWLKLQSDKSHEERAKLTELQLEGALSQPWDFLALEASNFRSWDQINWGPLKRLPGKWPWAWRAWQRGFPYSLEVFDVKQAIEGIPVLLETTPISSLVIRVESLGLRADAECHEVLKAHQDQRDLVGRGTPEATAVAERILSEHRLGKEDMPARLAEWAKEYADDLLRLTGARWFSQIRDLAIAGDDITIGNVLQSSELQNVAQLRVRTYRVLTDDGADPFHSYDAMRVVVRHPRLKSLRSLWVDGDRRRLPEALMELPALTELAELRVDGRLPQDVWSRILWSTPNLRHLGATGGDWAIPLMNWSGRSRLQSLYLKAAHRSDLRLTFAQAQLDALRSLTIQTETLDGTTFEMLCAACDKLQRLSLAGTDLDTEVIEELLQSHSFRHLLALDLTKCSISDDGLFRLAKASRMPKLRWVRAGQQLVEGEGAALNSLYKRFTEAAPEAFE
ncbi:MAG: hypothetical protein QM723_35390 [Myxococcaceae bacterium]